MIEVVAIGDELLRGMTANTNAACMSKAFAEKGWDVSRHTTLPDHFATLKQGLAEAMERSSIVIATGGLGPTVDDLTREIAAELFDSSFRYDETVAAELTRRYGAHLPSLVNQATVPAKAKILLNKVGTAPGLIFHENKRCLVLLPGIPYEMKPLFTEQVLPYLMHYFPQKEVSFFETLHLVLLSESAIDPLLRELKMERPSLKIGIYPDFGILHLFLQAPKEESVHFAKKRIEKSYRMHIFPSQQGKIEEALQHLFILRKKTLACAESCTGGAIAQKITSLPGASNYFLGSLVAYSNVCKTSFLSVSPKVLEKFGAVSQETVQEMLEGLFKATNADYGIAVSGIAGPGGGTPEKPMGTICAAIGERGLPPEMLLFRAPARSREAIIHSTTQRLLSALWMKVYWGKPIFHLFRDCR